MVDNDWRPGLEFIINSDEEAFLNQLRRDHKLDELDAYLTARLTGDPTAFNVTRTANHVFERLVKKGKDPAVADHVAKYVRNVYNGHHR